jgi:hypothetical protein
MKKFKIIDEMGEKVSKDRKGGCKQASSQEYIMPRILNGKGAYPIGKAHVYKFLFFDLKIAIFSNFSLPIGAALRAWLENLMAFSVHLFQREMNKYWQAI